MKFINFYADDEREQPLRNTVVLLVRVGGTDVVFPGVDSPVSQVKVE